MNEGGHEGKRKNGEPNSLRDLAFEGALLRFQLRRVTEDRWKGVLRALECSGHPSGDIHAMLRYEEGKNIKKKNKVAQVPLLIKEETVEYKGL